MVSFSRIFVGFHDTSDNRQFGFRAQNSVSGGPFGNWIATQFDGDVTIDVPTGIPVATDCAGAQDLEIRADGEQILFFINGVQVAIMVLLINIFNDNFKHGFEANQGFLGDEIALEVDYSCVSMGRKCQNKPSFD